MAAAGFLAAIIAAVAVVAPSPLGAQSLGPGAVDTSSSCKASVLQANDDESTGLVPIGFPINFFGVPYRELYVNNNGNVTFDAALSEFTPFALSSTSRVIIAPFFADVDTRASDAVTYGTTTFNGRPAFCANWADAGLGGVGYYSSNIDKLNSFQLLLVDRSDVAAGDFDIVMNFDKVQWETGDASGGSGGLGGSSARMGYSNGTGTNSYEHPGSAVNGAFLDTNSQSGLIHNSRLTTQLGRYIFLVRGGNVDASPPPASPPPPAPSSPPSSPTEPPPPPPPAPVQDTNPLPDHILVADSIDQLPDPTPFRNTNVQPEGRGDVFVKLPASSSRVSAKALRAAQAQGAPSGFLPLQQAAQLPIGTIVEATRGKVAVESSANRTGSRTQTARFNSGRFQMIQKRVRRGRTPVTEMVLKGGTFRGCPRTGRAKRSTGAHDSRRRTRRSRVRRLWGNGRGRFRTRGRYGSATVRGTKWLLEDRCGGTLTRLPRRPRNSRVDVRDFGARKTIRLRAGRSYLALPRGVRRSR